MSLIMRQPNDADKNNRNHFNYKNMKMKYSENKLSQFGFGEYLIKIDGFTNEAQPIS